MNPLEVFSKEEINKINSCAEKLEDRIYTNEEWIRIENNITEYIMNGSTKNGDIDRANSEFSNILDKIAKYNIKKGR